MKNYWLKRKEENVLNFFRGHNHGVKIMSDFDILTKWMQYTEDEANQFLERANKNE